jgi:tRNA-uridine 2-sulfurtransferase
MPKPKAIALLSGGLDSLLAAQIVKNEGVEVLGLHLLSPFGCREEVARRAEAIGVPVLFREKGAAYLDVVKNPKFGYGKAMNPCIDCRIYMFEMAASVLEDEKADFIITGEVVGQRPMSQHRKAMDLIKRNSPMDDRILRPLSADAFPPTLAEREGWVKRENLLKIRGRGRNVQLSLTEKFGITDYATPGGGCLLTEPAFNGRLSDFFKYDDTLSESERLAQSELLRVGRHFRLSPETKVVVAKNDAENQTLKASWSKIGGTLFEPVNFTGPLALLFGVPTEESQSMSGAIISRYGKPQMGVSQISYRSQPQNPSPEGIFLAPEPLTSELLEEKRL